MSTARSWAEVGEAGGVTEAAARHFGGLVDRKLAYMTPEWTLFTARGRSLTELASLWGMSRSGACKKRQRAHLALHGGGGMTDPQQQIRRARRETDRARKSRDDANLVAAIACLGAFLMACELNDLWPAVAWGFLLVFVIARVVTTDD